MNRDEGSCELSHVYDIHELFTAAVTSGGERKLTRSFWRGQQAFVETIIIRVFQHSVTQKVMRTFLRNRRRCNGACGFLRAPQANRNDVHFYQSELRLRPSAAVRNVAVSAALRLRYVALRCVALCNAGNVHNPTLKFVFVRWISYSLENTVATSIHPS